MKVEIYRYYQDKNQTSGVCIIFDKNGFPLFSAVSLERGWRNNHQNISCVPVGSYKLKLEYSDRFKTELWELKGVPNRSECKFHSSNHWHQLNGCISLGNRYKDIDKDGYKDVVNSVKTHQAFHEVLKGLKEINLTIY